MPRNDGSLTPYLLATQARSEELLLREIAKAALVEFEIDACDIFLKVADMMVLRASTTAPEFVNRVRLGPGVGLCGRVFDNGKAMFVERGVENLPDYARYPGIDHPDWQAAAILPFEFDGRRFGVAMLRHRLPKKWPASMQGRLGEWATGTATAVAIFDHAHTVGTQTGTLGALSDVSRTIASSRIRTAQGAAAGGPCLGGNPAGFQHRPHKSVDLPRRHHGRLPRDRARSGPRDQATRRCHPQCRRSPGAQPARRTAHPGRNRR